MHSPHHYTHLKAQDERTEFPIVTRTNRCPHHLLQLAIRQLVCWQDPKLKKPKLLENQDKYNPQQASEHGRDRPSLYFQHFWPYIKKHIWN